VLEVNMKHFQIFVISFFGLLCIRPFAIESMDLPDAERVARAFLVAVSQNDQATAASLVTSREGLSEFAEKKAMSADEKERIKMEVEGLKLKPLATYAPVLATDENRPIPEGGYLRFSTSFRGTLLILTLKKVGGSWKVDLRWWREELALARGKKVKETEPEFVIKTFLLALMRRDEAVLSQLVPKGTDIKTFYREGYRPPFEDQYYYLASEMPVVEVEASDLIVQDGRYISVGEKVGRNRAFVGLFGPRELFFILKNEVGKLKVIPRDYLHQLGL
jgi:hypothetical protein